MHMTAIGLLSNALLFLLIGGMAGSCDAQLLRSKFTTASGFRGILAGLGCQFVLLPLLAFISLTLFPQSPATAISLLIVTTSPGGGFSGFWCFAANADLALSVAMTTASTLFSVIALPVNVMLYVTLLYGRSVDVGYPSLLLGCAVVVSAVFSGYLLSKTFPHTRKHVSVVGQTAGVALMALGALANTSSSDPVWGNPPTWFAAVTMPVIGGLCAAMAIAKGIALPNPEAVAVAIECCYQVDVDPHAPPTVSRVAGLRNAIPAPHHVTMHRCDTAYATVSLDTSRQVLRGRTCLDHAPRQHQLHASMFILPFTAAPLPSQNTGLALTIALSAMGPDDVGEASGVPLVYGIVEILVIPVFAITAWRLGWTYAPKSENCIVALVGNYQPTVESGNISLH